MRPAPHLFLDASVWVAAAGSQTGGSALVLALCRHGKVKCKSSRLVLLEAERNIQAKLGQAALLRFYQELASLDLDSVATLTDEEIARQTQFIDPKDAHVLAAAIKGKVDFLLTLDRKDFMTLRVQEARFPFQIMTPGDFLKHWLKQHNSQS